MRAPKHRKSGAEVESKDPAARTDSSPRSFASDGHSTLHAQSAL